MMLSYSAKSGRKRKSEKPRQRRQRAKKIREMIDKYSIVVDAGKVIVQCETTPKQQDEIMAAVPDIVECWEYDTMVMDAKLDRIFESLTWQ